MAHLALEVANAIDASVILSGIIIEFDTDPLAGLESGLATKSNESITLVGQLDSASNGQLQIRHLFMNRYLNLRHDAVLFVRSKFG
jgi:hypothetical protein